MGTARRGINRWEVLAIGVLLLLSCALFLPAIQESYDTGRVSRPESQCANAMKWLALALHNYHDAHGALPLAISNPVEDGPPQSWRVLILPYLDRQPVYKQYQFDKPWDSPQNALLQKALPSGFDFHRCPANDDAAAPVARTHYLAVIGPHTAWRTDRAVSLGEVTDGTDRTILLVEVASSDVNWFEPRDLEWDQLSFKLNDPAALSPGSRHVTPGGLFSDPVPYVHVLLVDGSVRKLPLDTPPETLKALLTIDGGETFDPPWLK
jgi:hypothetical protein